MLKKRFFWSIIALVVLVGLIAGCSSSLSGTSADNKQSTKATENQQEDIGVLIAGSASQGGSNYLIMSGWTQLMKEKAGIQIRNESTGGPAANMMLMNSGEAQAGVLSGIVAREGMDGDGWTQGEKLENVRAIFGLHNLYMDGLALQDSGIKSFQDLDGKRVSVGPAGGTPYVLVKRVFKLLGIEPKIIELGQGDSIDALKNKQLDAVVFAGAFPRPAYVELEASSPVNYLSLTDSQIEKIVSEYPAFKAGVIPAGTYKYLEEDNKTLVDRYMYAVSGDLPEDVVYKLTKTTIDNFEEFQKVHKSLKTIELKDIAKVPIPLHPGAVKAMKEAGIEVPEASLPPEMK